MASFYAASIFSAMRHFQDQAQPELPSQPAAGQAPFFSQRARGEICDRLTPRSGCICVITGIVEVHGPHRARSRPRPHNALVLFLAALDQATQDNDHKNEKKENDRPLPDNGRVPGPPPVEIAVRFSGERLRPKGGELIFPALEMTY